MGEESILQELLFDLRLAFVVCILRSKYTLRSTINGYILINDKSYIQCRKNITDTLSRNTPVNIAKSKGTKILFNFIVKRKLILD